MANGRPYGNDFLVDTPALDRLHQNLYLEQKNRELQRQREVAALDDEYSRNVSQIKDADVDDLTKAYSDYKQSTQQAMKQKGGTSPQQQLELLRKKAAMYKLIQESKAEKENIALLGKAIRSDAKGIYDEKAAARLAARLKTPTSKYGTYAEIGADGKPVPVDLRDENGYLYKLGVSDFSKDFEAARGKDRDLTPDDKVADPKDPLNFVVKQYKGKNSPIEFYNTLLPRIAGSKEQKDFVLRTELEYPPEKAAALEARYKQLTSDPSYRKRYGLKDGDEIPLSSYDSPVARAVRLKAMEHAVNSPIIEKVEKIVPNKSALMDRTENFKKVMQAQGFENAKVIAAIRNSYSNMNYENRRAAVGGDVDAFIDDQKANANEGNWITGDERTLKVSPIILESFKDANSGGYTPTEIRLMPDGNYKLVGEQGKFPTQVITPAEYKAGIVNKVLNTTTKINQVKQPSNTPETRLPKDIKQTKMQPKATKPKPY